MCHFREFAFKPVEGETRATQLESYQSLVATESQMHGIFATNITFYVSYLHTLCGCYLIYHLV